MARGLVLDRSHPYCIVSVHGPAEQQQKTETVSGTNEPQWNKLFQFSVIPPHMWKPEDTTRSLPLSHYVKLEMWNYDMLKDDFMGMVILPLVDITDSKEPLWYKLTHSSSSDKQTITGEIKLNVYYSLATVSFCCSLVAWVTVMLI